MQYVFNGTQPWFLNILSKKRTHCAIDEDPQKFPSNRLKPLAVVQLAQGNLFLKDVVFQEFGVVYLEHPLVHGHDLLCTRRNWRKDFSII